VRADGAQERRDHVVQALADEPTAVLAGRRAAAETGRPGRQPEAAGGEQAPGRGAERAHRGQHGPHDEDRAGGEQRNRHEVVDGADQVAQPLDERGAALASLPPEVHEEGEEDGERDQSEADEVPVALLEDGQPAAPRRRRRRGAAGARLAACGGGHASAPPSPPAPRILRNATPTPARLTVPETGALRSPR
jgi:hypothetical protein